MTADTNDPKPRPSAPQLDESSAERSAFMAEIRKEVHDARRKRLLKYGGGGAIGVAVLFALILWWALTPDRKGCFANDTRKVAYESVRAEGDSATSNALTTRFNRKEFRCAEIADPKGTLVSVKEDGDPIIWYVNDDGKAFNVNLLSAAWTPRLATGPQLNDAQVAGVVK